MSKFSTVYDQLRTELATIFPNKTEIPIPESLTQNDDNLLRDGYGLIVGPSTQGIIDTFKDTSTIHSFDIVLTRELIRLEHDTERKHTETKNLIEDLIGLRVSFLNFDQLTIEASIQKIDYNGMSEISFVNSDKFDIISASINFNIEITETI